MLTDARELVPDTTIDGDVAIVGAGPAGITLGMTLAAHGNRVVMIDSGGKTPDGRTQRLSRGRSVGEPYFPLDECRVRGFGGTSNHWHEASWFRGRPLDGIDFENRPGIRGGWPFDRSMLDPYYPRALELCGLGSTDFSVQKLSDEGGPTALPLDPAVIETVMFKLSPADTWRRRFDPLAKDPAIELVLHTTVVEIVAGATSGEVTSLRAMTLDGTRVTVRARHHVLAAGGIENARLMLMSTGSSSKGLGNESDLVGRHFMEHLGARTGIWHPSDPEIVRNLGLYHQRPQDDDRLRAQAKLSPSADVLREEGILNGTFLLYPMPAARAAPATRSFNTLGDLRHRTPPPRNLLGHAGHVLMHPGVVATTAWDRVRGHRRAPDVIRLQAMFEQAPRPESRVTLARRGRDPLGRPLAQLEWRLSEIDRRSIRIAQDLLDEQLRTAGLGSLSDKLDEHRPATPINPQWHHMGTTRMDPDPGDGVVDTDCRVHGFDNLHVVGSSVFPTGGYANPTVTLVALALRLGDRLHEHLT